MKKAKAILALMLSIVMMVSLIPTSTKVQASYMPLETKEVTLDLSGYLPEELQTLPWSVVTDNLKDSEGNKVEITGKVVAYALGYIYSTPRTYYIPETDGTLNLVQYSYSDGSFYFYDGMHLICGDEVDQLSLTNKRYVVRINTPGRSLAKGTVYLEDGTEEDTRISKSSTWVSSESKYFPVDYLYIDNNSVTDGQNVKVKYTKNAAYNDYKFDIYLGLYSDTEVIPSDKTPVNSDEGIDVIVGGEDVDLTFVIYKGENVFKVMPQKVRVMKARYGISWYGSLYEKNASGGFDYVDRYSSGYTHDSNVELRRYQLYKGDDITKTYYYGFSLYKSGFSTSVNDVEKAVVGNFDNIEAASDIEDIKNQLFDGTGRGYGGDFSNGLVFTAFMNNGQVLKFGVIVEESDVERQQSSNSDVDVYFYSPYKVSSEESEYYYGSYNSFMIDSDYDSYYSYGYRPILIMDKSATGAAIGVEVGTDIKPDFYTYGATLYLGGDGTSGVKQESGKSVVKYDPEKPVFYTATSEDGTAQKNYWISYLSQVGGPKLFVNGTTDESSYVQDGDKMIPAREVMMTADSGNYHDIFFANIGDENIENIYVRLENAQNVKIDSYWNIGKTTTLSAFTTTESGQYGELANIGKIRLVPSSETAVGAVSGDLIIGHNSGEGKSEEIKIKLAGFTGEPRIITDDVIEAVKYVPYSTVIQNNCINAGQDVTYTLTSGELPEGLELKKNGEIYGVPTVFNTVLKFADGYHFSDSDGKYYDSNNVLVTDEEGNYIKRYVNEETNAVYYRVYDKDDNRLRSASTSYIENDDDTWTLEGVGFKQNYYSFTVEMEYNYTSKLTGEIKTFTDSHKYTLYVYDNTKANIEEVNNSDHGYKVLDYLAEELNLSGNGETLRSEGVYADFVACYLDGVKLVKDTDYTTSEGSTKITISDKTLTDAGLGEHTIAAEFRDGGNADGAMKASAQKFEIKKLAPTQAPTSEPSNSSGSSSNSGSSSGSGSSGSGTVTTPTPTVAPTPTPKVTESTDAEGKVTKVTETTAADKSKVIKTEVEKKNGNTRVTTEYIDAKGNTTKTEEVKNFTNESGTKVHSEKTENADGSESFKEVRTRKSGNVLTKTLKTDSNGNTDIKFELVKKNGQKTAKSYKVTDDGKIELKSCTTTTKSVKIASKITVDGKTFEITSIASKAFKGNDTLTEVTIGKNITSIASKAFYGCSKLATIRVNAKKLETVGTKAFGSIAAAPKFIIKASEDVYNDEKDLIKKSKVAKATEWVRK